MSPALLVAARVSIVVAALGVSTSGQSPEPARRRQPEPMPVVSDFSELRARPGDEQLRAEFLDRQGEPLRNRPNMVEGPGFPIWLPTRDGTDQAPPPPAPSRQTALQQAVCSADVVVSGQVMSKRVLLNRSETDLFTDFRVVVDQWLRPAQLSLSIIVSERGGKVNVGGKVFTTNFPPNIASLIIDPSAEAPNRNRDMNLPTLQPHLLLLRRIPKTQSFQNRAYPIPIVNGQVDLVSLGPLNDPRGPEPFSEVAAEITNIAAGCAGR